MDTIAALSSGQGKAGIAVVRISGPGVRDVLSVMAGGVPVPRKAVVRAITDPVRAFTIDRGIVLWFPGPASFTGEDMAELHVHGGRAVVAAVLAGLRSLEVRAAEPGEFARRAFENGKLDLTEAEGLADLIDAETEGQRRQAQRQAEGELGRLYDGWRSRLIGAMAQVEAAIDFSDEGDVAGDVVARADADARGLREAMAAHLQDGRRGEILRDGFQVVIAGPPNAGKSSLLNALTRREAAIVSAEPGTTRDPIEVRLDLGGLPVVVCDTAGLRTDPAGPVEQEGMRRTLARSRAADLVIWLVDASAPVAEPAVGVIEPGVRLLRVVNKADLAPDASSLAEALGGPAISARDGSGLAYLAARIADIAREAAPDDESPVLTQARHRVGVEDCLAAIDDYLADPGGGLELRAEELRRAAQALGRVTGRVDCEDVLDQVFQRFCIGK